MPGEWPGTGDNPWLAYDPASPRDDLRLSPSQADWDREEDEDEHEDDEQRNHARSAEGD